MKSAYSSAHPKKPYIYAPFTVRLLMMATHSRTNIALDSLPVRKHFIKNIQTVHQKSIRP